MIVLIYSEIDHTPGILYPVNLPDAFRLIRGFSPDSVFSWTLKRDSVVIAEVI